MTTTQETGMRLQEWAETHQPAETLIYKNGYWDQIIFVRDAITPLLAKTDEEYKEIQAGMKAISEHTSKSVRLPVFRVELADGTAFTMRYNFYDWKVSVSSPRDVEADFMGLFNPNEHVHEVYCEGFPKGLVYGPYAENKRQFTIELPSGNYHLFTFFWIFAHQVLGIQNKDGRGA
ncbi:MAG: hypothetical protein A3A96_02150 [Candidatus Zambryskibacteria bacterium RIFCSPLOWO2_01_FULL_39_39]|uniref:Uncharacterized protein n=1 Tax=Candidatus Zambryskibacteria bacterium RIFCSPLOWO2_01_FULL_39_39 TaxID=1802758 RepID=A0A1G2TY55_9BACT|nr:MAG: hypothetical protein A3A96_02150 [Candidatus Zambryskibacteria bacterium RIFCSPLOWO2_01_FULL_39_39]